MKSLKFFIIISFRNVCTDGVIKVVTLISRVTLSCPKALLIFCWFAKEVQLATTAYIYTKRGRLYLSGWVKSAAVIFALGFSVIIVSQLKSCVIVIGSHLWIVCQNVSYKCFNRFGDIYILLG